MYKITNESSVSFLWICCLLISIVAIVIIIIACLIFPEQLARIAIMGIFFFAAIFMIIQSVSVFDFENSGEVVLIRNYSILNYVFENRYHKKLELPRNKILEFEIKKTIIRKYLKVKIERFDGTKMIVFFTISYLSSKDIRQLTENIGH